MLFYRNETGRPATVLLPGRPVVARAGEEMQIAEAFAHLAEAAGLTRLDWRADVPRIAPATEAALEALQAPARRKAK